MSIDTMRGVVILHDREHGDFDKVRRIGNLGTSLRIRSFTDLIDQPNIHNSGLAEVVTREANLLLIQERLLNPATQDALLAINNALFNSALQTEVGIFNDDYALDILPSNTLLEVLEDRYDVRGSLS